MTTAAPALSFGGITSTFHRATDWLDARGRGAWIATMVLAFIFVWPVGLFILGYMIWSKRMFGCRHTRRHEDFRARMGSLRSAARPSGNSAFDAYKADTLRRLEDEQEAFESFLRRLREAKDKQEFDSFMEDRARAAQTPVATPDADDVKRPGEY